MTRPAARVLRKGAAARDRTRSGPSRSRRPHHGGRQVPPDPHPPAGTELQGEDRIEEDVMTLRFMTTRAIGTAIALTLGSVATAAAIAKIEKTVAISSLEALEQYAVSPDRAGCRDPEGGQSIDDKRP